MILKLSLKNIKKCLNDYSIYFITLTVAVSLSYIFNLIPYQPFMNEFSQTASKDIIMLLAKMSLPITFIVAGLALYSNNFLLKRRSREIGIYLILGTKYSYIHLMLLFETLFISIISFFVGIGIGVGLSRIFDLLIVNLLGLETVETSVVFAFPAIRETLKTFGLIFLLIAVLNYFVISRAKLIDMVNSSGESIIKRKIKNNIFVQLVVFILSVLGIIYFYIALSSPNVDLSEKTTVAAMLVGMISHLLFFISGSGVVSYIVSRNKRILYKGINLFTLKQITNKISKNGIMLGIITMIMTITMIMLNMGFSSRIWVEENLKYTAPYSVSVSGVEPGDPTSEVINILEENGYSIKDFNSFKLYNSEYLLEEFINVNKIDSLKDEYKYSMNMSVKVIRLSDYNKCREMIGSEHVKLGSNEAGVIISDDILPAFSIKDSIILSGNKLSISKNSIYNEPVNDARGLTGYAVTIIADDSVVDSAQNKMSFSTSLAINTNEKFIEKNTQNLSSEIYTVVSENNGGHKVVIQNDMRDYNLQHASIIIFAGLFIGLLLLIVCASILSLQQMAEITENKKGYEIIKKIGVKNKNANASISRQILTYFIIPLIVASVHSVFGTVAYSNYSLLTVNSDIFIQSILTSLGVIAFVFFVYITFTYRRCKKYIGE
ncbi:MAG: hypothetical protein DBX47_06710 [Clostridiales bacterium]|nr:MAG: hypothetical protein DBX47_06710 [Clostridiales bacterium]